MSYETIISCKESARHRTDHGWVVVDCRSSMAHPEAGEHHSTPTVFCPAFNDQFVVTARGDSLHPMAESAPLPPATAEPPRPS